MKKDFPFYRKLFLSTFTLSAFTFGGGYVIVPLMRQKFVHQYHWLSENEMLDMTAIAQSSPGPIAVNASILIGFQLAGIPGALVSILGTVLPPFIILSLVSLFYTAFRDNGYVAALLRGMQAGVAAVIADVVISMAQGITAEKNILSDLLIPTVFIASYFFHINVAIIILICGVLGALVFRKNSSKKEG